MNMLSAQGVADYFRQVTAMQDAEASAEQAAVDADYWMSRAHEAEDALRRTADKLAAVTDELTGYTINY